MRRLVIFIIAMSAWSMIHADSMRMSDSVPSKFLGSLYYGINVGYELNFETDSLNLLYKKGEGKLLRVTIVVPREGNKYNVLPEGEFMLGSCDSISVRTIDYYESSVKSFGYKTDNYEKPEANQAFAQCKVAIKKIKRGIYEIRIEYELENGEKGEYTFSGRIRMQKQDVRARFKFMSEKPRIKNWELTNAKIEVYEETAYHSREAILKFVCADEILGMVVVYLPMDSINGKYFMRYGKNPGKCESSTGGFDGLGYYNLFNTGIEEDSSGFIYYPETGYVEISDGKMFFEFVTKEGSVIRGVYKGDIPVIDKPIAHEINE